MTLDELLSLSIPDAEQLLIDFIERLKQSKKSFSRINTIFCTIKHLYVMNDIRINERKIDKFLGERTCKIKDRAYTHEVIKKLIDVADIRVKIIILLMASTGMRVGAV
jgi:integrase